MGTYLALLRGVNVGGNKLPMAGLRELFADLGHTGVRTHLQTGNVVFRTDGAEGAGGADGEDGGDADREGLAASLATAIGDRLGATTTVLLRTRDELAAALAADPFGARGVDPARRYLTFLGAAPEPARVAALVPGYGAPDAYALGDRVVYVHCPDGYGRTKLSNAYFERALKVPATSRGQRVAARLLEMLDEPA